MGGLIFIAVIIAWLWFCVWLARKVVSWIPIKSGGLKGLIGLLAFAILLPLPLIDEIIGKIQFDKLCREEAGVKIYGKLKLGPEFFNPDGTPNFIDPSSGNINDRIEGYLEFINPPGLDVSSIARLGKKKYLIKSRKSGQILLEQTSFGMHGGWLAYDNRSWLWNSSCLGTIQRLDQLIKLIVNQN